MTAIPTRVIGDRRVSAIGLGTSLMSLDAERDDTRSIRAIRDAIDAGLTLIDTAHAYTTLDEPTHAERLVRDAIAGHPERDQIVIATKGGHWRRGEEDFPIDGRAETLRVHLDASLRALDVEAVDLYQLHHPDPAVPIEESVGALAEFQKEGLVRMIGVSNVDRGLFDRAVSVAPIATVQNQLSPFRIDDLEFIEHLAARGVAYLSHSPFGGRRPKGRLDAALPVTARIAASLDYTVQQIIIAWQLSVPGAVIPIPGARRSASISASISAAQIELSSDDQRRIREEFSALDPSPRDA